MDLDETFDALNLCYFEGLLRPVKLGWMEPKVSRRWHVMGLCWGGRQREIKISKLLALPFVPPFYASYYMFHEMLHLVYGSRWVKGKLDAHPPSFLAAEARYVHMKQVRKWERKNLGKLLSYGPAIV